MAESAGLRNAGTRALLAMLMLAVGVLITACGADADPDKPDNSTLALGESVYGSNCASCHGQRGEGQPDWRSRRTDGTFPAPPHDSSGHTWHHPDDVLIEIIKVGGEAAYGGPGITSWMPAFGGKLTDEEIAAVLAYLKSLWGDEERTFQESLRPANAN